MIPAGDIGGTKTQLALYTNGDPPRRPWRERRFASHDYASLEALALDFLRDAEGARVTRAVFGIAGVVTKNRCETTNLPWHVDGAEGSRRATRSRTSCAHGCARGTAAPASNTCSRDAGSPISIASTPPSAAAPSRPDSTSAS